MYKRQQLINRPNLILQPNLGERFVREKLQDLGYTITAENIIEEDGHIYEIIVATDGEMSLTEDEKNFGRFLSKEKNDLFIKKQKQELDKVNYILSQLEKAKEEKSEKVLELQAKAKKIKEVIS